jgi:hypothetical protein
MPKVTLSPLLQDFRGKLGNIVFRRMPNGDVVVSKAPDMSKVKWSKAQKAHRLRFKQAIAYAKAALADPAVRRIYVKAASQQNKRPFHLAISDHFKGRNLLER